MNIDIHNLMNSRWAPPIAAAAVGFAIGAVGGHIYESRKEEEGEVIVINIDELRKELDESIEALKDKVYPEDEEEPDEVEEEEPGVRVLTDTSEHPSYGTGPLDLAVTVGNDDVEEVMEETIEEDEPEVVNIFAHSVEGEWNWETELQARKNAQGPFPIHEDEYMTNEEDSFPQSTVTYYEADDIMADSNDTPLYGWQTIIGPLRWGFGSSDANSFYVRNPAMKAEYEVLRDPGSFSETVLGLEADADQERAELKHSRTLRFRLDD